MRKMTNQTETTKIVAIYLGTLSRSEYVTDMARHPSFRGIHFGKILRGVETLAAHGLCRFDGATVSPA